jgi:hypothetical protein
MPWGWEVVSRRLGALRRRATSATKAAEAAPRSIEEAATMSEMEIAGRAIELWWSGQREEAQPWIDLWHARFGRGK